MKRLLLLVMSGIFALTLSACGEQNKGTAKPEETNATSAVQKEEGNAEDMSKKTEDNSQKEGETGESTTPAQGQ